MKLEKVIAVRTNKTVYRDGHLAIKVFDSDYSKADVLNEALNQARVEETALNVPRLHEVCTVDGKWAIVSDFIPGKTLARLMEENPDRRDEYMALFVDLQLKMHAQTCPLLNKLKAKMNRTINETGPDATTRYELHARLQGMPTHKKLCLSLIHIFRVLAAQGLLLGHVAHEGDHDVVLAVREDGLVHVELVVGQVVRAGGGVQGGGDDVLVVAGIQDAQYSFADSVRLYHVRRL